MKIIKKIAFATEEETVNPVIEAFRSDPGVAINTGTLCTTETPDVLCYLYSTTFPIISSGDIIYNTNNQTSPFNGGGLYYKMTNGTNNYVGTISALGVIAIEDICL